MKKDTINLVDTFKIFKKNLKTFYIFIFSGLIFGLLGALINTNYIEAKSDVTIQILIKNPLKNYFVLDLFTLDTIEIEESGNISVLAISEKIKNYNAIASQYLDLMTQTIDLNEYINIEENNYELTTKKDKSSYFIKIKNVINADEIRENLSNLSEDFNSLVSPIIIQNIKKETEYMEGFLNSMENNLNPPNLETLTKLETLIKLRNQNIEKETEYIESFIESTIKSTDTRIKTLIKLRKNTLKRIENRKVEIFDTSISITKRKTSNSKIIIFSFLLSISMFLLFIIVKR